MQITSRLVPRECPQAIRDRIAHDVPLALNGITTRGDQFIVNDTLWYGKTNTGAITPTVMNAASFISKKFQTILRDSCGWRIDASVDGQEIDGFVELETTGGVTLSIADLCRFLPDYVMANPAEDADKLFRHFYQRFAKRRCFGMAAVTEPLQHYFLPHADPTVMRVGLEFETGNIASSFRALTKLGNLFTQQKIDAAVFVTCTDKANAATRIWPQSNRNGSFEELEHRAYGTTIDYPLWEFGFAPDAFSAQVGYLGPDGQLYQPTRTDQVVTHDGRNYRVYQGMGREVLLPEPPQAN